MFISVRPHFNYFPISRNEASIKTGKRTKNNIDYGAEKREDFNYCYILLGRHH